MKQYFKGTFLNGSLALNKQDFKSKTRNFRDGKCLVMVMTLSMKTPDDFRTFYFAMLAEMSLDTGIDKHDLHDMAKKAILTEMLDPGEEQTTTNFETADWQIYIDKLSLWALKNFDFII